MFFLLFLRPSGLVVDKQTGHGFSGLVKHATVGIQLEVPVPKNITSTTVAILVIGNVVNPIQKAI
jgi:hypothetical protein